MEITTYTVDMIRQLKKLYPDVLETDPEEVGTPNYWKKVGVVELVRTLEAVSNNLALRDKKA